MALFDVFFNFEMVSEWLVSEYLSVVYWSFQLIILLFLLEVVVFQWENVPEAKCILASCQDLFGSRRSRK